MSNPYSPPNTNTSVLASDFALYSPGHIAWASFLGSPLAGGMLMALNYFRLHKPLAGNVSLGVGLFLAIGLMVLSFFLPDSFPNSVIPLAYTFGMYQATKLLQGDAFSEHLARGGRKGSGWVATGIGVICLIIFVALLFAVLLSLPEEWLPE
ncbi:MAG: hypothetical protein KGQ51_12710 [Planctomycetes bacterium]|nr:hypothetical protein [Planctomycetota bacterium]